MRTKQFFFSLSTVLALWWSACSNPNQMSVTLGLECDAKHNCGTGEDCLPNEQGNKICVTAGSTKENDTNPSDEEPTTSPNDSAIPPEENSNEPTPTTDANYPPGPYGIDVGETFIPIELEICSAEGQVKKLNFRKFYNHSQVKVLQLTVHTGW